MISFETSIRVRYAETDKMGYVYYGNYATYFEVARVEALRSIGISYKKLEDDGVMLPVYKYSTSFYKPAHYDDELIIKVIIKEMPQTRIHFYFETFKDGIKLNDAEAILVFVDMLKNKPCMAPDSILKQFKRNGL